MSPREKQLAILSALGLLTLSFYYIPTFLCFTLLLIVFCLLWYYFNGELLPTRFGLHPRAQFNGPAGLRRSLWGWGVAGVSAPQQKRTKSSENREPRSHLGERFGVTGIYRRESETDSFLFSPRDFLMGSYISKPQSPPAASGRPRAARNPREQLREKLSRPNHAVYTPNRRLSFAGYVHIPINQEPSLGRTTFGFLAVLFIFTAFLFISVEVSWSNKWRMVFVFTIYCLI